MPIEDREQGKLSVDDPSLIFLLRLLYLILAPLIAGLAASTALRATLYAAFTLYILPASTFTWDLAKLLVSGSGPPSTPIVVNELRVMLGSAVLGGVLGLVAYGGKRLVRLVQRLLRRR